MLKQRVRKKTGFTLAEVLVTVAIVSVLAAIVVPAVTSQLTKGDDTSVATNIMDMRTAITAFVSDTRKFPSRLQNLTTLPAAADLDINGNAFGAAAVARWKGPYMTAGMKALAAGAKTDSVFIALAFAVDSIPDTLFVAPFKGMIGLKLGGVPNTAAALHIDSLIDGATGQAVGNLQWAGVPPAVTNNRLVLILLGK